MSERRMPHALWAQAQSEFQSEGARWRRYIHLMVEEGHLTANLDDLLTPEQHQALNDDLAKMALIRRTADGSMA